MDAQDGSYHFQTTGLANIEPFTIIFFQNEKLSELRWDGHQKYFQQLDNHSDYIWSSVTLYSDKTISKKKDAFLKVLSPTNLLLTANLSMVFTEMPMAIMKRDL